MLPQQKQKLVGHLDEKKAFPDVEPEAVFVVRREHLCSDEAGDEFTAEQRDAYVAAEKAALDGLVRDLCARC